MAITPGLNLSGLSGSIGCGSEESQKDVDDGD
jgi:hypothetical protein